MSVAIQTTVRPGEVFPWAGRWWRVLGTVEVETSLEGKTTGVVIVPGPPTHGERKRKLPPTARHKQGRKHER